MNKTYISFISYNKEHWTYNTYDKEGRPILLFQKNNPTKISCVEYINDYHKNLIKHLTEIKI